MTYSDYVAVAAAVENDCYSWEDWVEDVLCSTSDLAVVRMADDVSATKKTKI